MESIGLYDTLLSFPFVLFIDNVSGMLMIWGSEEILAAIMLCNVNRAMCTQASVILTTFITASHLLQYTSCM